MSNIVTRPVISTIQALQVTMESRYRVFSPSHEGFDLEVTTGEDVLTVRCRLEWGPESLRVRLPFHPGGGYSSACVRCGNHLEGSQAVHDALLSAALPKVFAGLRWYRLDPMTAAGGLVGPFELGAPWRPLREFHPVRPPDESHVRLFLGFLAEDRGKMWAANRFVEAIGRGKSAAYPLSTELLHALWLHHGEVAAPGVDTRGARYQLTRVGRELLVQLESGWPA